MRKVLIMTFVSIALAGISAPAFAEDDNDSGWNPYSNSTQPVQGQKPAKPKHDDDPANEAKHNHLKEKYDDVTGVVIPPVAIKPDSLQNPSVYQLPNVASNPDEAVDNTNTGLTDDVSDALTGVSDTKTDYKVTKLGSSITQATKTAIKPNLSQPVQIKTLVLTTQTPTDEFMGGAMVLGGSLAVVAFGLLTLTSLHHLRLRRKL